MQRGWPSRFSTSGLVGEGGVAVVAVVGVVGGSEGGVGVEVGGRGFGRAPLSRGERGRGGRQRGEGDKDFQGQVGRLQG